MAPIRAIDLFAGAGGFSEGARRAGCEVVWAANHWELAVQVHRRAHPTTAHACQDLQQADFTQVPNHDLLLASPACQGHSRARGQDRPHHDATRATAWAVIAAVEAQLPRELVVENVPEFAAWKLFPVWCDALRAYGYHLTTAVLDAADVGVPQHRRRLFVVGSRRGPIELEAGCRAHVPAREIVELEAGTWSAVRKPGRALRTLNQVAAGWAEFGDRAFLAPYYGRGSGTRGRSLERPIGTITARDAWAIVQGERMRMLTVGEYRRAMGFPAGYGLERLGKRDAVKLLGNAVPPALAEHVIRQVISRESFTGCRNQVREGAPVEAA